MKILISGGCGFLGRNLIPLLSEAGNQIICVDRSEGDFLKACAAEFVYADLTEGPLPDHIFEGVDVVIHMACTLLPGMANSDPLQDMTINIGGALHLLDSAVKNKVRKVIFFSSGGTVYGIPHSLPVPEDHPLNPQCAYGISKLAIEKYMRLYRSLYGIKTCSLRLSNPYGPHQRVKATQGVIPVFCYKALMGEPIEIWGDGSVRRDFIYIDDVISAISQVVYLEDPPEELNIGSGKATSINELLKLIAEVTGKKLDCRFTATRNCDVPVSMLDISRIKSLLPWVPRISLKEGLQKTVEFISKSEINC